MHYLTYILAEWDEDDMPEDQLDAIANELLDPWHNEIWDWLAVGGRWNGVIPGNRIPVSGNEERVLEILDNVENLKKVEVRIFLREVLGEHVSLEDLGGHAERTSIFGLELPPPDQDFVDRANTTIDNTHALVRQCLVDPPLGEVDTSFLGYKFEKLGNQLGGNICIGCGYIDTGNVTARTQPLRQAITDNDTDGLWLIAVDLHY